jgi:hypothetical protein
MLCPNIASNEVSAAGLGGFIMALGVVKTLEIQGFPKEPKREGTKFPIALRAADTKALHPHWLPVFARKIL